MKSNCCGIIKMLTITVYPVDHEVIDEIRGCCEEEKHDKSGIDRYR